MHGLGAPNSRSIVRALGCSGLVLNLGCASQHARQQPQPRRAPQVAGPLDLRQLEVIQPRQVSEDPQDLLVELAQRGVRGEFIADLQVGADGRVTSVELLRGLDEPADALLLARVAQLVFEPASMSGVPVESAVTVTYRLGTR